MSTTTVRRPKEKDNTKLPEWRRLCHWYADGSERSLCDDRAHRSVQRGAQPIVVIDRPHDEREPARRALGQQHMVPSTPADVDGLPAAAHYLVQLVRPRSMLGQETDRQPRALPEAHERVRGEGGDDELGAAR